MNSTLPKHAMRLGSLLNGFREKTVGLGLRAFAKNAATLSAGTLGAQLITIAIAPVLTRQYGTAAFGVFSVFSSVIAIAAPIISLRLDYAIPLPSGRRMAMALCQAACASIMALSLILGAANVFMGNNVSAWLSHTLGCDLQALWFALPAAALQLVLTGWNVRRGEFRALASGQLISALIGGVTQLFGGFFGAGALGLMVGWAAGMWFGCVAQARSLFCCGLETGLLPIRLLKYAAVSYRQFLVWTLPSSAINTLGLQLVPIIVVASYGAASGGLFFLAYRVVNLPMGLVGTALGRVMWGEVAKMRRNAPEKLRPLFLTVSLGALLLTAPGLLFVPVGREVFSLIFGRDWGDAGALAAVLFFSAWIGVSATTSSKLSVLGYNHWQAAWEIGRLLLTIAAAGIARFWVLPLLEFAVAVTVAWSISYLVLFALNFMAICRTEQGVHSLMPDKAAKVRGREASADSL